MKSNEQLIKACLRNDIRAQNALYKRFAPKMMGVCLRYAKSRQEAEDLLQEGFWRVFSDLSKYQGKGAFEGWMRKVIVNTALQHIRKKKDNIWVQAEPNAYADTAVQYNEVFHQFMMEDLFKVLTRLPEGCKIIFNLYVIEGFSHKEIAEQLGISIGTSKSQLSKARALIKNQLTYSKIRV